MKAFLMFLLVSHVATRALAQSGPAGVGTSANNTLWLKADAGTSTTSNNGPVSA